MHYLFSLEVAFTCDEDGAVNLPLGVSFRCLRSIPEDKMPRAAPGTATDPATDEHRIYQQNKPAGHYR